MLQVNLNNKTINYFVLGLVFLLLEVSAFNLLGIKQTDGLPSWIRDHMLLYNIKVPVAWCSVNGSPAASDPNIPNPSGGTDRTTEDILWRRHERTTDNIFLNQAGITFRSAINDPFVNSFTFPKIEDPNLTFGLPGDLDLADELELVTMINSCLSEWQRISNSNVFPGILSINVNRIINSSDNARVSDIIGMGWCTDQDHDLICDRPYDGILAVIDNRYMIPGLTTNIPVTDTCPPPEVIWNKDPFDQILGHEFGHTLGLQHRNTDPLALMNKCQLHEGTNGMVNNINMNATEINKVRSSALAVPGHELYPLAYELYPLAELYPSQNVFPTDIVRSILVDDIKESKTLNPFEDISVVKITLDKKQNNVAFGLQLLGTIPEKIKKSANKLQYWILLDLDDNHTTGGNSTVLKKLGVPSNKFVGAELVINMKFTNHTTVSNSNLTGHSWLITDNGNNINNNLTKVKFELQTFEFDYIQSKSNLTKVKLPQFDTVNSIVDNSNIIKLNKPIKIQAIVDVNGTILDLLDDKQKMSFMLSDALYPQCSAKEVGKNAIVNVTGLLPNKGIHILLGPRLMANSTTDNYGNSTIQFHISDKITSGLHLITVGVDKTALTADCEILLNNTKLMIQTTKTTHNK